VTSRKGSWARRVLVDVTPLRELPDYRRLFSATLVSTLGSQLTVVAIPFQVYRETHSSFQVGAVSLAGLLPLITGSLVGGSVGDAVDRRTILLITGSGLAITSSALAVNAASAHPAVWLIYIVSGVSGGLIGFASAAQTASVATLVGPLHQSAAAALSQITFQIGTIAGPAAAGLLVSFAGLSWVYGVDVATWIVSLVFLRSLAPIPPQAGTTRPGLASVVEGVRFLKGRQALQGIYIVDLNAMVFGMPRALFPALALGQLHAGVSGLGYLYAAPGVGAFIGSLGSGWVAFVRRQGLAVIVAVLIWGASIVVFGLVHVFWVALVLLVIAGWADVVSAVLRSTILQTTVPEEFRSRLSSIQIAVVQGGPRLGDLEAGSVAAAVSTGFSVVSGGVACIVGVFVTSALLPGFVHHERVADPQAPPGSDGEAAR
jgi:predicted MFS family arabinose efflux permease